MLGNLLETQQGVRLIESNEFFVEVLGCLPETMLLITDKETLALMARRWRQFERAFVLGSLQAHLPPAVRRRSVITAFNVPDFQRRFAGRNLARPSAE